MKTLSKLFACTGAGCLSLLLVKYPLRKLQLTEANKLLMRLHEPASAGFFLFGLAHMGLELMDKGSSKCGKASGLFGMSLSTWLITDCHIAKDPKAKMDRHRIYSLLLTADTAAHLLLAAKRRSAPKA